MKSRAFTLIELLVAVLIIGILAAVALPQYRVAVGKAKFMELIAVGDAIRKAEELYYLENGSYTSDPQALALSRSETDHISNMTLGASVGSPFITLRLRGLKPYYVIYLEHVSASFYRNRRECRVDNADLNQTNKQICANLTGSGESTGKDYSCWVFK